MLCKICWEEKQENEFRNSYKRKDWTYWKRKECIECEKQKNRLSANKYYLKNRIGILNKSKTKKEREKRSIRRKSNIEVYKEIERKNRIKHREKRIKKINEWREDNKEHILKYNNIPENKIRRKLHTQKRRQHIKERSDWSITIKSIQELFIKQDNICIHCNCDLIDYHIDHITPISKWWMHIIENIQLLCPTCNLKKGNNFIW